MEFENTSKLGPIKRNEGRALGMHVGRRLRIRAKARFAQQTFGHALHLEECLLARVLLIKGRCQMRNFVGQSAVPVRMNLMPDFKNPKLLKISRVAENVLENSGQQTPPQMRQLGRNRITHANVLAKIEM